MGAGAANLYGSEIARRADLVFPRATVAVFVDGCFWHRCPVHYVAPKANAEWWRTKIDGNWKRDRETDQLLANAGWCVLRFWEHEEPARVAAQIEDEVRRRVAQG